MPLLKIRDGKFRRFVEDDCIGVTYDSWLENRDLSTDQVIIAIPNDVDISAFANDIDRLSGVILDFPSFKDGRAYSQARLLRERFEFTGEVRARGDILLDQILFMVRCGFDAFEFDGASVPDGVYDAVIDGALREFSYVYQFACDGREPVRRKRASGLAAA